MPKSNLNAGTLWRTAGLLLAALLLAACNSPQSGSPDSTATTAPLPTQPAVATTAAPAPTNAPDDAPTATTAAPAASPTDVPTATEAAATEAALPADARLFRVAFVTEDDTLNMRSGPGADNPVVATLPPVTGSIAQTGPGERVGGAPWAPVRVVPDGPAGWVHRYYLTEDWPARSFCNASAATDVLMGFEAAMKANNGEILAGLVHPDRGLLIRRNWWNNEIQLTQAEVATLFDDPLARDWGTQTGSGNPIVGSTNDIIVPYFDAVLNSPLLERECNAIAHGPTAGLVQLPREYGPVNFYSLYRPAAPDQIEFDWGTWVVGIELWDGVPYIAFLVYFDYEI